MIMEILFCSNPRYQFPVSIEQHETWKGNGWDYKRKWGKTQSEMVDYLINVCKVDK